MSNITSQPLDQLLKILLLPTCAKNYKLMAEQCVKEQKTSIEYLHELATLEVEHRYQQRINRLLHKAKLPRNKLLKDFNYERISGLSSLQVKNLATGNFIDNYENILIFGNPGTGKTHLSIALAREWCFQGRRIFYSSASALVQQLLQAKLNLQLTQFIKKLDYFEVLLIDDISYVPYDRSETDVLFTLLSARYETRSVLITSNLQFANWNTIFKDEMTTAAAIDRLIHHSVILELNAESYRISEAKNRKEKYNK